MPVKALRRLVIDASVARSSGEGTTYPSKYCRDFLIIMMETSHLLVMTPKISDEWNRHQSNFARKWLVGMVARKRVDNLDDTENNELSKKIKGIASKEKDREAMLKDFHLIEAALASDRSIISLDETVRKLFAEVSDRMGEIRDIVWVNPAIEEEQPITWLQDGAKAERKRQLGYRTGIRKVLLGLF